MIINSEIKEHRLKSDISECLKSKRIAERNSNDNVLFQCILTEAELETNIDGSKTIKKIIISN